MLGFFNNLFYRIFLFDIGNLVNFEILLMGYNLFIFIKIFEEFGRLKKFMNLWMWNCSLIGEILFSFVNFLNIKKLELFGNNLVCGILSGLFYFKNLIYFYLYNN